MTLKNKTDEELMILYQNGSTEAFQALYDRHAGKIFGFIKNRIPKDEQAKDIFQGVFIKIHKSKHLYNKTLPVLPWIFTITKNVLIDDVRKEKSAKLTSDIDLDTIAAIETVEMKSIDTVLPHLAALPEAQRTALQLRYVEEKTFEEIAERLDKSALIVRQLISRGTKRVKELIGGSHEN